MSHIIGQKSRFEPHPKDGYQPAREVGEAYLVSHQSPPLKLTNSEAHDLTPSQLNELREIFNCFDTDGNGTISREEFAKILNVVSLNPSAIQLKLLMSQVDINGESLTPLQWIGYMQGELASMLIVSAGDGQIAFDEFVECFGAKELTSTPDVATLQETFRVFDKDNDGYITPDELQTVLRQMGLEVSGSDAADILAEADTDDAYKSFVPRINVSEFKKMVCELPPTCERGKSDS
uniref:EF-hand domain-containing protein n=1 Tax=Echinococcus canadensis TaxID=519352 RepID=A0A915ETR2_9CEST